METVLMYPYNKAYKAYVWYGKIYEDKIIKALVSPNGWGMTGDEVQSESGKYVVSSAFSYELRNCSMVWFVEDDALSLPEELLISKVQESIDNGKKILYTRYKNKKLYHQVMDMLKNSRNAVMCEKKEMNHADLGDYCYSINVPIVTILGIEEGVQKFDVQSALCRRFRELGYTVEAVSTRLDSDAVGIHSIPQCMFDLGISDTEKIIQYNHYVKQIERNQKPDLIILGVPGSVMPFDKVNHNNFGVMAYLISMAVSVDYGVLCTPFYIGSDFDFTDLKRDIQYKFGFPVDYCHIAPVTLDLQSIYEDQKRRFFSVNEAYVQQELEAKARDDAGYVLTAANIDMLTHRIIERLA